MIRKFLFLGSFLAYCYYISPVIDLILNPVEGEGLVFFIIVIFSLVSLLFACVAWATFDSSDKKVPLSIKIPIMGVLYATPIFFFEYFMSLSEYL